MTAKRLAALDRGEQPHLAVVPSELGGGTPLPQEAFYNPNDPVSEGNDPYLHGDPGTPGASQVIGYATQLDSAPVVPWGAPEPPKHDGVLVKVRDGNLYVDGQLADPDRFIDGMRLAIKLT